MLLGEVGEPTEVGEGATRGMDPQDIFVKEVFLGGHLCALGSDWPSPTSVGMAVILGGEGCKLWGRSPEALRTHRTSSSSGSSILLSGLSPD